MHDDALKQLWKTQRLDAPTALSDSAQVDAMKTRMKSFDKTIRRRDYGEVAACIFIIAFFGWDLIRGSNSLLTQAGCVVLIASSIFIGWKLIVSKLRLPKAEPNTPVFEAVKIELQKVENQIRLLKSIAWWYLLPLLVGVMLHYWGSSASFTSKLTYSAVVLVVYALIHWLNQRAVKENLLPLKRELESLLDPEDVEEKPKNKKTMSKLMLLGIGITLCASIGYLVAKNNSLQKTIPPSASVPEMLELIRAKHNLPALAAAVVLDGKIVETNAVGVRVNEGAVNVTAEDKFHIGSVTKSMTATVAAMLVEAGKISWTTTIGESFPEFKDKIHPDYLGATLEQLLANRGGVPGSPTKALWSKAWEAKGTPGEQRLEFIKGVLAAKPEAKPGTKNIYSNSGFSIAGVMLEKASGKSWEELMRTMLFEPLGMTSAGFGAPASLDKIDQPWGHAKAGFSGLKPVPPGPRADNPLAISPAGAVHCSLGDLAKYAAFHMAGERGESKLLKTESFKKLHTAVGGDDYALGWVVTKRPWANGRALMHNGSNTMFYVVVWMAPEKNCAVIVASNVGADQAFAGCDEAAGKLIQQYFAK